MQPAVPTREVDPFLDDIPRSDAVRCDVAGVLGAKPLTRSGIFGGAVVVDKVHDVGELGFEANGKRVQRCGFGCEGRQHNYQKNNRKSHFLTPKTCKINTYERINDAGRARVKQC